MSDEAWLFLALAALVIVVSCGGGGGGAQVVETRSTAPTPVSPAASSAR